MAPEVHELKDVKMIDLKLAYRPWDIVLPSSCVF